MNAAIIIIGDELLSGKVVDINIQYLARKSALLGLEVKRVFMVGDNERDIVWALNQACYSAQVIFVSGGLGPTPDDCTRNVISKHFASPLVQDEEVLNRIIDYFIKRDKPMPAWIENQALIPRDAVKLINPLGTAPGLLIKRRTRYYFFFPGVPAELVSIFEADVKQLLDEIIPQKKDFKILLRTTGISEAKLWELIDPYIKHKGIILSYLPSVARVDILIRSEKEEIFRETVNGIKKVLKDFIYSLDEDDLNKVVGGMLKERGATVAVSESCTGGLLGSYFTDIPGSSEYFKGGVIAYSNELKISQVGVKKEILAKYGAVSSETAVAMAQTIRIRMDTDIGIGITGIAGPGGGSKEKPIGLVYVALAVKGKKFCEKYVLGGDRHKIREHAAIAALDLLRRYLVGIIK